MTRIDRIHRNHHTIPCTLSISCWGQYHSGGAGGQKLPVVCGKLSTKTLLVWVCSGELVPEVSKTEVRTERQKAVLFKHVVRWKFTLKFTSDSRACRAHLQLGRWEWSKVKHITQGLCMLKALCQKRWLHVRDHLTLLFAMYALRRARSLGTHTEGSLLSTYTEKKASALKNQSYTETPCFSTQRHMINTKALINTHTSLIIVKVSKLFLSHVS